MVPPGVSSSGDGADLPEDFAPEPKRERSPEWMMLFGLLAGAFRPALGDREMHARIAIPTASTAVRVQG